MSRRIAILGATGSIGGSTLDLIERHRDRFVVSALTAQNNVAALADAARRTGAELAVIGRADLYEDLRDRLAGTATRAACGAAALDEAAQSAPLVMAAIVGCAGLRPVMAAVRNGATIALANKEALVSAGTLMTDAALRHGATILPVDSEHNAIFQCLEAHNRDSISRLILTASGGPFRTRAKAEMAAITPEQAVAHPNWSMGAKISVDSATMMNKGLELIEAHHLFGLPSAQIDIIVHPQSVVHSMVEYVDGSVLAQMGSPDMRIPIAHILAWPQRMATPAARLDLTQVARLDFAAPDVDRFPALRLARAALEAGGAASAILNAANEQAVAAFLERRLSYLGIAETVEDVLGGMEGTAPDSLDSILAVDAQARRAADARIARAA